MADESYWVEQAQTWQAKYKTLEDQVGPLKEKAQGIKQALCAREKSDGSFDIDFEALVTKLGPEGALELRATIDAVYSVSGEPGRKPRIRVKAA